MSMTIISEKTISMPEVKEQVDKIHKRDKEPGIRTTKTKEYLDMFVKLKGSESKELKKKLEKLNVPRLKEEHITKIIDVVPTTVDSLKSMLQGYIITINKENMKKIVDVVKPFVKNKK